MTPAVFLDRDGTLLEDVGYLDRLERLALFPWSVDAVRLLNRAGFRSSLSRIRQVWLAASSTSPSSPEAHRFIGQLMAKGAAALDALLLLVRISRTHRLRPIAGRATAENRAPGMLQQAARELDIDLRRLVRGWGSLARYSGRPRGWSARHPRTHRLWTNRGSAAEERSPAGRCRGQLIEAVAVDACACLRTLKTPFHYRGHEDQGLPKLLCERLAVVRGLPARESVLIARPIHPLPGEAERRERLVSLVDRLAGRRVLVVGDVIADEFIYGQVARVSREAPVLILQYDSTEILPGGAGNAASNVAALGGRAQLIGLAGRDEPGRRLGQVPCGRA